MVMSAGKAAVLVGGGQDGRPNLDHGTKAVAVSRPRETAASKARIREIVIARF
jgi:hypothetical protein